MKLGISEAGFKRLGAWKMAQLTEPEFMIPVMNIAAGFLPEA